MTAPSGLSAQCMLAEESVWGTYVAVNRTYDLVSETMKQGIERIESKGLRAGRRVLTSQQWTPGKVSIAGDLNLELNQVNFGVILKHALGAITSTNSGTAYTYTVTPGDLTGKGLSVQIGRPDITATVRSFSYTGCKINQWELSAKAGELVDMKLSLVGQAESTSQTLGTPYYPRGTRTVTDGVTNGTTTFTSATAAFNAGDVGAPVSNTDLTAGQYIVSVTNATTVILSAAASGSHSSLSTTIGAPAMAPLTFIQGTLTNGGVEVDCKSISLKGNNNLDSKRYFVRPSGQLIKEPLEAGLRTWDGTLTADFTSLTQYTQFTGGTESALVLQFQAGNIPGSATPYSLTITMNVRLDGDTPVVPGPQILEQPLTFKAIANTGLDSSAITAVYVTSDAVA